ncbi:MAG TPA: hypothetical protein VHV29_06675 [Terriglobales bacterium]|jgi:NADH dehydrogenase|nr:hypothetical protein [Terriglobales bacterium]
MQNCRASLSSTVRIITPFNRSFIRWLPPEFLAWLFVHIFFLIGFRNRVIVLIQWAWSYLTYERGARLITGDTTLPGWQNAESENEASAVARIARQ